MKKVLFVGLHPFGTAGNSGMMQAILSQLDKSHYSASVFAIEPPSIEWSALLYHPLSVSIIPSNDGITEQGFVRLYQIITQHKHDAVVFVGLDIWEYIEVLQKLSQIPNKPFKIAAIFPYDLQNVRKDWVKWIDTVLDYPCVYSQYGENMLKDHIPRVRYFRPPLKNANLWKPDKQLRREVRQKLYPSLKQDDLVFAFIGLNQKRKDPQRLVKAFSVAQKECPNIYLFLQTRFDGGMYNLIQAAKDYDIPPHAIIKKSGNEKYLSDSMPKVYNSFDVYMNCSLQEGLSWTVLEAMLSGVSVIASDTTAHTELVGDAGILVPCTVDTTLRVLTESGPSHVDAKRCNHMDIADAIITMAKDKQLREKYSKAGVERGKKWLKGVSNINDLLSEMCKKEAVVIPSKINAVLFAQHSSAGDVLMTTRCFKGIKERYGLPLHYMTSKQYVDIVVNNPYIDKVIPWEDGLDTKYRCVVNPHGERIAPGHWGRNSNSLLSDFYWKILEVEPDDFFIELKEPDRIKQDNNEITFFEENENGVLLPFITSSRPFCILHTTGGDSRFRIYKFMRDIHEGVKDKYTTIQLGGVNDFPAWADVDLRGKLSFREAAWVMSKAFIAVTVDSFISHLAGALGVSQVCLFGSGNHNVVRPNQVKGELICMIPDYVKECVGLGPCSAAVRDCPATCTGRHDPKNILKAIEEIERRQKING